METFKLGRFDVEGKAVIGRLIDERVEVVCENDDLPAALARDALRLPVERTLALADVRFLAPVAGSSRIFAVAVNYRAHGREAQAKPPARPLVFYKAPSNFVGHGGKLNPHKDLTAKFDYEGEIAVVIGKPCSRATPESALNYVAGVCPFDDGSARDLGKLEAGDGYWPDWTAAKGLDGASALGPTIACGAAVIEGLRKRSLSLTTRLNDELVQEGRMTDMIFSTEQIISTLSAYMVLLPGDVIATGTPAGVGMGRNRFLQTGDRLEISIQGIDTLRVTVG